MWKRLRRYFLTGLVVTLPLALTWFIAWFLVSTVDHAVEALLPTGYTPVELLGVRIPGIGIILVMLVITFIGSIARNFMGRRLIRWGDYFMTRMPLLNTLYTSVKQLLETLLSEKGRSFKEVVWVNFPAPHGWSLGFVTSSLPPEKHWGLSPPVEGDEILAIYMPVTPVPTSGFLLYIHRSAVRPAQISVEEGLRLVVSGGITSGAMNK